MSSRNKDITILINHASRRTAARTGQASNIMTGNDIFDELFVLEVANNHLGDLQRGLKIISNYAQVVRFNNVRAAIKLQLRDIDSFIHRDFRHRDDIRYIKKTLDTRLHPEDLDRKSTRLNSSHQIISYAVFCLKKKNS